MKSTTIITTAVGVALGFATQTAFGLAVTPSTDGDALVNVIKGSGITIVPGSVALVSGSASAGTFTGGLASGLAFDSGILLTSGDVANAPGPNNQDGATGYASGAGDADLNTLIPGYSSTDTTYLQFDFTSAGADLYFNYVFASEEYNEYSNTSFNDVFGFFLDGVNVALLPDGVTPVSINNVNGGNPFGTNAKNPAYYLNNDLQDGGPFFDIQYDGMTVGLTVTALNIGAGTHTIKLAISDAGDQILDSGVFIQGNSFSDDPKPFPDGGATVGLLTVAMIGLGALRRKV